MKYVDADVLLHWATDHPQHGRRATEIIRGIERGEKAMTSSFSLWLFDKVMERTEGYVLEEFMAQLDRIRNIKMVPLEADHVREAAEARAKFRVPTEIAMVYAVARSRGVSTVYSTNELYDRTDLRREF